MKAIKVFSRPWFGLETHRTSSFLARRLAVPAEVGFLFPDAGTALWPETLERGQGKVKFLALARVLLKARR
jgi:hypothetical protein